MTHKSFRSFLLLGALMLGALISPIFSANAGLPAQKASLNPDGLAWEANPGPDGTLWISDNAAGEIRAYAADGSSVGVYSGLGQVSDARPGAGSTVWYVDQSNSSLMELDTSSKTTLNWVLSPGATGFGTALDNLGRVWVSDFDNTRLFRFDPATDTMCVLDTSALAKFSGSPYLAFDGTSLWFSDFYGNALLRLDTSTNHLTRWLVSSGWDFEAEGLASDGAGGLWFADAFTTSLGRLDLSNPFAPRLLRYALPIGGGIPHMLVRDGQQVWYSGVNPSKLGSLNPSFATPTQFTPQVSQADTSPTCAKLEANTPQSVAFSTQLPDWTSANYEPTVFPGGWQVINLPATSTPWGLVRQGNDLWAVDQGRYMVLRIDVTSTVTACYLSDEDGDLSTTGDRSPIPGETVYLHVNYVRQVPGALTADDGCHTWTKLAPYQAYGVEQAATSEWELLNLPGTKNLGQALPGETLRWDFIFKEKIQPLYLPVMLGGSSH